MTKTNPSNSVRIKAKERWRPNGPAVPGFSITDGRGGDIWCRTRACADYIASLLRMGRWNDDGIFVRINRALEADGKPGTCFPPAGAGDVVGPVV